jgi:hypothetical protein
MTALSDVSVLVGQRARDIEKAREIFTAEIRSFVAAVLGGVRRTRTEPWTTARVRIDLPKEIETEGRLVTDISSQFAAARATLRFKKGTVFQQVAEVRFGIECADDADAFGWQVTLVPAARFNRVDDVLWHQWQLAGQERMEGTKHQDRANTIRFVRRPLSSELTGEIAYNDVKAILEFLLSAEAALGEAVGLEPTNPDD